MPQLLTTLPALFVAVVRGPAACLQIGWATDRCTYKSEEGVGIGDDIYSFAYDGQRGLLWHRQENWPHEHKKWRQGDVLGVLLDLDAGRMKFSLNGALPQRKRGRVVTPCGCLCRPSMQPVVCVLILRFLLFLWPAAANLFTHRSPTGKYLKRSFPLPKGYQRASFYPAASLMTFQHLEFNFGSSPYR